jgi:hypothetical protein
MDFMMADAPVTAGTTPRTRALVAHKKTVHTRKFHYMQTNFYCIQSNLHCMSAKFPYMSLQSTDTSVIDGYSQAYCPKAGDIYWLFYFKSKKLAE